MAERVVVSVTEHVERVEVSISRRASLSTVPVVLEKLGLGTVPGDVSSLLDRVSALEGGDVDGTVIGGGGADPSEFDEGFVGGGGANG